MMNITKLKDSLGQLPVSNIVDDVVDFTLNKNGVSVVGTSTGSGKTLLIPPTFASVSTDQILVLEPRRFLAVNAASTACDLAGLTLGDEVGYAVGVRGRETGQHYKQSNQLVYSTYGYALSSGLIKTAKIVFIDEAHEQTLDMDICKAILKNRMAADDALKVVVMSATMDGDKEALYWEDLREVKGFTMQEKLYSCNHLHRPGWKNSDAVLDLITNYGRKGILVFEPGKAEIGNTTDELKALAEEHELNLDIATLHGESEYSDQKTASAPPKEGAIAKVLIGTNVIESGVNFSWVDAGASTGTARKMSYHQNGTAHLKLEDLPQWNVKQQEGRTDRFCDSVFILTDGNPVDLRTVHTHPEILRMPLTALIMHCAALGINPEELHFQNQPNQDALIAAYEHAELMGFVHNGKLTEDGEFVTTLPVDLAAGAFLAHAKKLGKLPQALVAAAVMSAESIRKAHVRSHGNCNFCDLLDATIAFVKCTGYQNDRSIKFEEQRELFELENVGYRRFSGTKDTVKALEKVLKVSADHTPYTKYADFSSDLSPFERDESMSWFRQCMLAAHVNFVGEGVSSGFRGLATSTGLPIAKSSGSWCVMFDGVASSSTSRVITPKMGRPFTVAENVTQYTLGDFKAFEELRPEIANVSKEGDYEYLTFNGAVIHTAESEESKERPRQEQTSVLSLLGNTPHALAIAPKKVQEQTLPDEAPMEDRLAALQAHFGK